MTDASHISPQVLRALQLKNLGRYSEAERAFQEALSLHPHDAFALHHLSACQFSQPTRHAEALDTIERAIRLDPNNPDHHILRSYILTISGRPQEGLISANSALTLDPQSPSAFTAQAQAYLQMENWPPAEISARLALALQPDHPIAANQLAQTLRLQNKLAENSTHLAGMLARDPQNAFTHANAGWSALQCGDHQTASTHFREALRLDPQMESARDGLLNSFRARSPLYRTFLRYCFFMQRLSSGARWAIILGLYFGVKCAHLIPGGYALVALYLLFVLWVWVAKPIGNFFLLFDSFARHALRPEEKREALTIGASLGFGVLFLTIGFTIDHLLAELLGVAFLVSTFPLSMTFTNGSRLGASLFGSIATLPIIGVFLATSVMYLPKWTHPFASQLFPIGALACLLSTWLGTIPALRRPLT